MPIVLFARSNLRGNFGRSFKDLSMMGSMLVVQLALTRLVIYLSDLVAEQATDWPARSWYLLVPFAAGPMLVRILTKPGNALMFAVVYAVLAGTLFEFDLAYVAYALTAGVVASAGVSGAQRRIDMFRAGVLSGLALVGVAAGVELLRAQTVDVDILKVASIGFLSGIVSAFVVNAILPFFEAVFRYTTSIKLLELANLNHPALRELILQAPGTYHHSMMVGQLVEAACESVGANALLGRVGAYYHDIGKMKNPIYFAENQTGQNPHDKLKPNMSALVIKAHVKDGVEMARAHRLPPEIIDFIREHHGTSLIKYFFIRAKEESDGEVNESDYRYPGPKPQSRETAICLLADGIEAASRAMPEPTPARLQGLVNKMINGAFTDGQLEHCDLTLRDLNEIAKAFIQRLNAIYHHRPEYPDQKKSDTKKDKTKRADDSKAGDARRARKSGEHPAAPNATDGGEDDPDVRADGGDDDEPPSPPPAGITEDSGVHLRRLGL